MVRRQTRDVRPCIGEAVPAWVVPIVLPTPYPIGPVTVYLLTGDPLTLVDTGPATGVAWRALNAALAERSLRPVDVRRVLLTHAHHDHFGLARRFIRLGASLAAHPGERRNLRLDRGWGLLWCQLGLAGMSVSRRLALFAGLRALDRTARRVSSFEPLVQGQELPHEHGPIRVHHLPGHTPGHVGFELGGEGVAITGDTVLDGRVPNAVVDSDPDRPGEPFQALAAYAATLAYLETLRLRLLMPAHGPCIADVAGQVAALRERQSRRSAQVREVLAGGPATVSDVMTRLFPRVALLGSFLAFSEVLGHILELERRGEVRRLSGHRRDRWELDGRAVQRPG